MSLESLGWNARLTLDFESHRLENLAPARVAAQYNEHYRLLLEGGERNAVLSGRLRHASTGPLDRPVTGDWVAAAVPAADGDVTIRALLPRRTLLVRGAAGPGATGAGQPLAANLDTLFIVSSLDRDHNLRRLERYLTVAWESGARPVVLLAKSDRATDPAEAVAETEAIAPGVTVLTVSALTGFNLEAVRDLLAPGETAAFVGSSGAGKSTLVNALAGAERLATGEVRAFDGRGRHTTVRRELVPLPGGALLLDTPGLRELRMWDSADGLSGTFADVEALAERCRFRDCGHDAEPGCAVRAALEAGELDPGRLDSFRKLAREIRRLKLRLDPLARAEAARQLRRRGRMMRDIAAERLERGGTR